MSEQNPGALYSRSGLPFTGLTRKIGRRPGLKKPAIYISAASIESSAAMSSPAGKHGIGSMGMCTLSVNDFNEFGDVSRNL